MANTPQNALNATLASQTGGPSQSSGPNQMQTLLQQLEAQYPGMLNQQAMTDALQGNLDSSALLNILGQGQLGMQSLQQNFANQSGLLGLSQADLGVSQGALNRQQGLLPQLEAITQQGFGTQQKGLDLENWLASFNAGNQRTAQLGSAAAAGATNTVGNQQQLKNIQDMVGYQRREIGLQQESLGQAKAREGLNYKESQAKLADQQKLLGDSAKRLGISVTQLDQQLQNGITSLGLSQQVSLDQLKQAALDRASGTFNPVSQILGQVETQIGLTSPLGFGSTQSAGG